MSVPQAKKAAALHPRLTDLYTSLPKGLLESVVIKNGRLDSPWAISFSDLVIKCKSPNGRERLVEFRECKQLRMIESYDEKTQTCVILRYWKDELKNDGKLLERRTTYHNVPKQWTCIDHSTTPEYNKFVSDFKERQQKFNAKTWASKKKGKTYDHEMWNIISVLKADQEMTLNERGPLMRIGWGFDQFKHGNYKQAPENREKKFLTTDAAAIKMTGEFCTEAFPGGQTTENNQNPYALQYIAYIDLLQCAIAEMLFDTETSAAYVADIKNAAAERFESGFTQQKAGAIMFNGGKPLSEKKLAEMKAVYDKESAPNHTTLLRTFEQKYMTQQVQHDFDKHKTGRFKDPNEKTQEIVAKFPKPNTERLKFECKLFRKPTDEELEKFKTRPYLACAADRGMAAYVAEFERLEAIELALEPEKRTPLCPPTETAIQLWRQHAVIRCGPRVMRMPFLDAQGKMHPARELNWKEACGALGIGAIAAPEIERGLTPECKMNCVSMKGKLRTIHIYSEAPARTTQTRKSYSNDEPVPGAKEVDASKFSEEQQKRAGMAEITEEELRELDAVAAAAETKKAAAAAAVPVVAAAAAAAAQTEGKKVQFAAGTDTTDSKAAAGKKRKQPTDDSEPAAAATAAAAVESPKKKQKTDGEPSSEKKHKKAASDKEKEKKKAAATAADSGRTQWLKRKPAPASDDDEATAGGGGDDD